MKNLDVIENEMKVGQVKTLRSDSTIELISLLFSPSMKAQFYFDKENNTVQITFSDTDLRIPDLECTVDKKTIKELIAGLRQLYIQLESEDK